MTLMEAVILGIVQGLTEPLPVSSSAHLVIVPALLPGFHQPDVTFDVFLHLGTLLAVVFFLRREIGDLLASLLPGKGPADHAPGTDTGEKAANRRMVLWLAIATFLTGAIGILFKDRIERLFESVETTAFMLLITGMLLFLSDRVKTNQRRKGEMNLTDGIVLGLVQAAALIPGISRSGSTITFGIFRGLERKTSATFSFLLSIPAISGAVILKSADLLRLPAGDLPAMGAGFLAAAVTGFLSLKLLFAIINKTGLRFFAYYCWFVGAATLTIRGMG
ncbi:MAG: undecaprenyl-diphosphate phosphatase [Proteobacteria bacterium]|nr:undecaprenyl-diphosphate phosphatase [Pseudomonadota bacterium]MBU1965923.1 undecaprenyl-diphosphate phosphatase [Pseudomonadota bacterium]